MSNILKKIIIQIREIKNATFSLLNEILRIISIPLKKVYSHKWLFLLLAVQIFIFSFLHVYGLVKNDPEKYFYTGQFIPENKDGLEYCDNCFYLGWGFKQAMDGNFLLEDKFQGHDTYRKVFHLWWIVGGHLARILGLDLITFNVLQRIVSGLFLSIVLYIFALNIFKNKKWSVVAVIFYIFGSFILYPWPEAAVFISNSAEVILPLGNALLVLSLFLTYRFYKFRKGNIFLISATLLILEMNYPYGMIMFTSATGLFVLYLLKTKHYTFKYLLKTFLIICIPAFLMVGYNYYLVAEDYRLVYCQANMPSPPMWHLFVGYLPFSIIVPLSIYTTFKKHKNEWDLVRWYLLFLLISNLLLMRAPISIIPFQMEMIVGIQLPISFFAVDFLRRIKNVLFRNITVILIFLITFTPNIIFTHNVMKVIDKKTRPTYLEIEHYEAMQWLAENSESSEQVLAMNYLSSYFPMISGNRIYNGEYLLISGYWPERQAKFENALNDSTGLLMKQFLTEEKLDYIFYCDEMAKADKSGVLNFDKKDSNFIKIDINSKVSIIKYNWKESQNKNNIIDNKKNL